MKASSKTQSRTDFSNGFFFVPMGGSEEFGINFNLYACDGKWVIFDCGIGFTDHKHPGVDILLPDPSFIEERRKDLLGLVITHAHEDHIGAVAYLWPRLRCPIYCTKFTAAVLRAKLNEHIACKDAIIHVIDTHQPVELGPYTFHFIHVTHSVPQAVATVIETSYGRVVHSGDWNLDPHPVIDGPTDAASFKKFGDLGVLAYIGDSTNAPIPGRGGSETDVEAGLKEVFARAPGRILVTIFASNIGRVQTICRAAEAAGRSVCLLGRSLHRMVSNAHDCGYLRDIHDFVSEDKLHFIPHDKILYLVTGSQGEAQAALAKIARGDWREIKLGRGDTAVFSSKPIPGNEKEINAVKNYLSASGVKVVDTNNAGTRIHVSGHPYRDEIADMLKWVRPQTVIPVHGEHLMLSAHAELAQSLGFEHTIVPNNGSVIQLAPGLPEVIDHLPTASLAVEPNRVVASTHKAIAERRKLQFSGAAHITIALNKSGNLALPPQVTLMGLIDHADEGEMDILEDLYQLIDDTILDIKEDGVTENARIEEDLRVIARQFLNHIFGFKPKVSVHLLRV